jgi:two-component system NarL family sensor kinase
VSARGDERGPDAFGRAIEGRAELAVALLRVALVPLVVLGQTAVDHPGPDSDLFTPIVLLVALWALGLLVAHALAAAGRVHPLPRLARVEPIVDLIALGALTYTSGGPYSEARLAFFALPLVAAFRLRPALTAAWTAAAIAVYVLISLPHPATRTGADVDAIVVHALFLMWAGAGAVVLSALLGARDRRLRALADERGRLVAQALTAEDRERQRLAELLHDDAIQNLLVARQELRDHHRRHDEDSYRRADEALAVTVDRLRGEIFELHPYVLDHAGLRAALTAHAESAARRSGARAVVEVDDAGLAESQQQLVLSLARELLSNAARHSGAGTIRLWLASDAEAVVLVVADDGAGFAPERRSQALMQGHIGMATSAERAVAAGGSFDVASSPGAGTTITVRLPRDDRRAA